MIPACRQNHAQAQNDYDSAENRLKRGVQRPIFTAAPEIKPHPPKGGPPSPIFVTHARARATIYVSSPPGLQILYASPRAARPLAGRLPWAFMLLALQAVSTTDVNWILYCKRLSQDFTQ